MKVDAIALTRDVDAQWKSVNVAEVNGSKVRVRVMQDVTARWHYHGTSHELFYVIAGRVFIDFDSSTEELTAGQLLSVPPMTRHRARATQRAVLLVIDSTDGDTHTVASATDCAAQPTHPADALPRAADA